MMITYRLIERLEEIAEKSDVVRIVNKARANRLITAPDGSTVGVEYEVDGSKHIAYGPVRPLSPLRPPHFPPSCMRAGCGCPR